MLQNRLQSYREGHLLSTLKKGVNIILLASLLGGHFHWSWSHLILSLMICIKVKNVEKTGYKQSKQKVFRFSLKSFWHSKVAKFLWNSCYFNRKRQFVNFHFRFSFRHIKLLSGKGYINNSYPKVRNDGKRNIYAIKINYVLFLLGDQNVNYNMIIHGSTLCCYKFS